MQIEKLVRVQQHLAEVVHGLAERIGLLDALRIATAPGVLRVQRIGGTPDDETGAPFFRVGVQRLVGEVTIGDAHGLDAAVPLMRGCPFV